jgi:hypothetical protein
MVFIAGVVKQTPAPQEGGGKSCFIRLAQRMGRVHVFFQSFDFFTPSEHSTLIDIPEKFI